MGLVPRSVGLLVSLLVLAGPVQTARAEVSRGGSLIGNTQGEGTRGGLFNGNITRFGVPDENGRIGAPKVGFQGDVNLAQGTINAGPCAITGKVGSVGAELSAGIGANKDATAGSPMKYSVGGKTPGAGAGGAGAGGLVQCNAAIEANLVSVEAECKTAIGTIKPSVKGPGGSAGCSCSRGCSAELYWAKAGIEYTTPAVGGCGIKASATVGAEVMAGVAAGAERAGTVGGKVKLGPVGVTAGINIEEFDLGKTADCIVDGAKAVGQAIVNVGNKAAEIGASVVNGIADAGKSLAEGVSNFFGGLFGGGSKKNSSQGGGKRINSGRAARGGRQATAGSAINAGVRAQGGMSDAATGTLASAGTGINVPRGQSTNPPVGAGSSIDVDGANSVAGQQRNVSGTSTGGTGGGASFLRP